MAADDLAAPALISIGAGSNSAGARSPPRPCAAPHRARFRRLAPDEAPAPGAAACNVLVMEWADLGSLRAALRRGRFHARLPGGAVGVHLAAALEALLDVAGALSYLHAMQLVHGDVKADNVLLKSDAARPLGFVAKLSDFGLARVLGDAAAAVNVSGAGTVTHLAPEMLRPGLAVTTAVDAYAFGVLM